MAEVFEAKVRPVGNSLGVILPNEIVKEDRITDGETILLSVLKKKRIKETDVFATLKGVGPFRREHDDRVA